MAVDWFAQLTGFRELSYDETRARLEVSGETLRPTINGRRCGIGCLETPTLAELRNRAGAVARRLAGRLRVSSITGDAGALHRDPANAHALFQVASQFNLLELIGPNVSPEAGVTRYAHDRTQGPACAIAAGAATIYRNYFVPLAGATGQTADRQIDCLSDVGAALGNVDNALWTMSNGYALCTEDGLSSIDRTLGAMSTADREAMLGRLRIGLHWNVEVTDMPGQGHTVSQAFCSALPVSYTEVSVERWTGMTSVGSMTTVPPVRQLPMVSVAARRSVVRRRRM